MALADNDRISSNALNRVIGNLWTKLKNTFLGKDEKAASAVLADRSKEINVITAYKDSSISSEAYMPVLDDMFFGTSSYSDCIFHIQGVYKKLADSAQPKNVNFDLEFGWRTDSSGNPNTGFCYMYSPYDISSLVGFRIIVWRDTGNNVSKGRLYVVNKDSASGVWSRVELSVIHKTGDASWKQSTSSTWETDKPSSTVTVDSTFTKVLVPSDISGKENSSNKVTAWSTTTTDTNYPSEKLVKGALDGKVGSNDQNVRCLNVASNGDTKYYKICDISMQVNGAEPQLFAMSTRDGGDYNSSGILCLRLVSNPDKSRADSFTVISGQGVWNGVSIAVATNADSSWTVYAQLTAWCALSIRKLSGSQTVTWSGGSATEALFTAASRVTTITSVAQQDGNYSGMTVGTATTATRQTQTNGVLSRMVVGNDNLITFQYSKNSGSTWTTASIGSSISGVVDHASFADAAGACTGSAFAATRDGNGNVISQQYGSTLVVSGNDIGLRNPDGGVLNAITVPYATKAVQDGSGRTITSTYAPKSEAVYQLTIDGRVISFKSGSNATLGSITVPGTNVVFNQTGSDSNTLYCF